MSRTCSPIKRETRYIKGVSPIIAIPSWLILLFGLSVNLAEGAGCYFALLLAHRCVTYAASHGGASCFLYLAALWFVRVAIAVALDCFEAFNNFLDVAFGPMPQDYIDDNDEPEN